MPKSRLLSFTLVAALSSVSLQALGQSVHSAAGVVPNTTSSATTTPVTQRHFTASSQRSAPPLPGMRQQAPTQSSSAQRATPGAVTHPSSQPQQTRFPRLLSFEEALAETVTIDVMDMALHELMEQLTPHGWRLRFQHVDQDIKTQRVDLTAYSTRGEVMYDLLSQAGLSAEPFEAFQTPLLLVTSSR